jgi:hypothetical protein
MQQHYFIICLGTLLSIGSLKARAQADFRPGYLVRPTGDTVRGQVNYRGRTGEHSNACFGPPASRPLQLGCRPSSRATAC